MYVELLCGHQGCLSAELWADGLCEPHWRRQRQPRPTGRLRHIRTPSCSVPMCPATSLKARGMCDLHYNRWRFTGDPGPADLLYQPDAPPKALMATLKAKPACDLTVAELFDPGDDEEPRHARTARWHQAGLICATCPARIGCSACIPDVVRRAPQLAGGAGIWAGQAVSAKGPRPLTDPNVKVCAQCHLEKPAHDYTQRTVAGHRVPVPYCKPCNAERAAARRRAA